MGSSRVASVEWNEPETFADTEEASGTYPTPAREPLLSMRFWGRDLCADLPREIARDGVFATRGELGRIREFLQQEFPSLLEEALGPGPSAVIADAKRRYYQTACDLIELRHGTRTVGVIVGAPEDWCSYYLRALAVIPDFQRPALTRRFARECLFEPLAACGVQRVLADVSPANLAVARFISDMHFHVTGHQLSERWGALVRYTKFLDPACEEVFASRFGGTAPPGSRGKQQEKP